MTLAIPIVDPALEERLRARLASVEAALAIDVDSRAPFVAEAASHLLAAGGKRFRPLLVLLTAECGPRTDSADVEVAARAVELVHLASLYHDDVMDEALVRRSADSANARFDNRVAILTGDWLFARSSELTAQLGPEAVRIQAETFGRLVEGQILEGIEPTGDAVEHHLEVVAGKTGALLSASATTGAVLAGADDDVVAALGRYGDHVGMAFQLMDDVLGIWGDPAVTGKPVLSDLRARKKTLAVSYALSHRDARSRALADWLAGDGEVTDESELHSVAAMIEEAGGRSWAIAEAEREVELAAAAISSVPLARPAADELVDLTFFLTRREA